MAEPVILTSQGEPINPKRETKTVATKVTIYNAETGDAARRHPVDAKEQVKSGRWSYEPVVFEAEAEIQPGPELETEEYQTEEVVTPQKPARTKRGRKR